MTISEYEIFGVGMDELQPTTLKAIVVHLLLKCGSGRITIDRHEISQAKKYWLCHTQGLDTIDLVVATNGEENA